MSLVPQTKTEGLINQLNALIESGRTDNELLIRRISKQSDDLLKIDPLEAYLVKGILASYNGQPFTEVRGFFEKALKINPLSCLAHLNYSVACSYAGLYSKEIEHMEKARRHAVSPREIESVARTYPKSLCSSFMFHQYAEITGDRGFADFCRELNIDEGDLLLLRSAVEKVHAESGAKFDSLSVGLFPEDKLMSIQYPVSRGADFAFDLTNKLHDELIDSELPENLFKHVSIGYRCV